MPRTPTGRPPGRPKSPTGYLTLMCRLPTDKAEHIVETARQRQITVSALLREALDTWLQTHQPQTRLYTSPPKQSPQTDPMKELVETTPTVVHPGGTVRAQLTTTTRGFAQPAPPTEKDNRQTIIVPHKCMTETIPQTDTCLTETGLEADNSNR